jgi:hypothetical protein
MIETGSTVSAFFGLKLPAQVLHGSRFCCAVQGNGKQVKASDLAEEPLYVMRENKQLNVNW